MGHLLALFTAAWAVALFVALREGVVRFHGRGPHGPSGAYFRSGDPVGYWIAIGLVVLGLFVCGKITWACYRRCLHPDASARRRKRSRKPD